MGEEKDLSPGRRLVEYFMPFLLHLVESGLSKRTIQNHVDNGCGSFAIEAKAQSFNQIDGVLSVPTARIRGDIDTPAGYLVHPRQV
jgi:hypothetical protein